MTVDQQVDWRIMSKQKSFFKHLLFVTFSSCLGKFFAKVFDNLT